jgi:hypothetical protein
MSNMIKNEVPSSCHPPRILADPIPTVTTCPENGRHAGACKRTNGGPTNQHSP